MHKLARVITGSRLYGYYTEKSDTDYIDIYKDDIDTLIGFKKKMSSSQSIQDGSDVTVYGLHHFLSLAIGGNPNILDILFSPLIIETSPEWEQIPRDAVLSYVCIRNALGYAKSALTQSGKRKAAKNLIAHRRMCYMATHLAMEGAWNPVLPPDVLQECWNIRADPATYTPLTPVIPKCLNTLLPDSPNVSVLNEYMESIYSLL